MNYYYNRVQFFPLKIHEDIIWNAEYAKSLYVDIEESLFNNCKNSKEKFWKLANLMDVDIESLYDLFVANYVKNKKQKPTYGDILATLEKWLSVVR